MHEDRSHLLQADLGYSAAGIWGRGEGKCSWEGWKMMTLLQFPAGGTGQDGKKTALGSRPLSVAQAQQPPGSPPWARLRLGRTPSTSAATLAPPGSSPAMRSPLPSLLRPGVHTHSGAEPSRTPGSLTQTGRQMGAVPREPRSLHPQLTFLPASF